MPLDSADPVVEAAVFGRQVEDFLDSPLGSYLLQCVRDEIDNATKDLVREMKKGAPVDPAIVAKAQHRIRVATSVRSWLGYAVEAGIVALEQLKEEA